MLNFLKAAAAGALMICTGAQAQAATVNIGSFDNGWYDDAGFHIPSNESTFTGSTVQNELRSWFAFDISGVGAATAISVIFPAHGLLRTNAGGETAGLFDYTGSIDDLILGTGGTAAFADLGSGVELSQFSVEAPDRTFMPEIAVELPPAFVAQFNALRLSGDPRIAFGATLLTIDGMQDEAFWSGSALLPAAILVVRTADKVPEPAALTLVGAGLAAVGAAAQRRRMA